MSSTELIIYDPDTIEVVNVPASFYHPDQEGQSKVGALDENLRRFAGNINVQGHAMRFPARGHRITTDVLVVAVDNRATRKRIWQYALRAAARRDVPKLLVDVRSGMDLVAIHTHQFGVDDPGEHGEYAASLEGEEMDIPCSARSVAYNSMTVAGLASAIIKCWSQGQAFPKSIMVDHEDWWVIKEW